ncbi:WAS/WASL-interacting protein family member 3-like isoform X2 [Manis pentadactyla]|nr:WAS/WASL-interacting protein family member 3-like isoform X2 [Manis pentadactyla]
MKIVKFQSILSGLQRKWIVQPVPGTAKRFPRKRAPSCGQWDELAGGRKSENPSVGGPWFSALRFPGQAPALETQGSLVSWGGPRVGTCQGSRGCCCAARVENRLSETRPPAPPASLLPPGLLRPSVRFSFRLSPPPRPTGPGGPTVGASSFTEPFPSPALSPRQLGGTRGAPAPLRKRRPWATRRETRSRPGPCLRGLPCPPPRS